MNINASTVCFWYWYSWSTVPYNVWMYIFHRSTALVSIIVIANKRICCQKVK
ncbi:hypothetical protein L873DRAFT_1810178 [Choiromyces venosus 120613-1]|uniref:Uncharacterized protein n=1 Tax=Choiromyces venosus 120613-1 TaxID=1336337 RepID=A0A3N4JL37_9PEZI|nr:hypothetical protein L873DRAFT_1810178 [Choiromyces venosus 120613-1]